MKRTSAFHRKAIRVFFFLVKTWFCEKNSKTVDLRNVPEKNDNGPPVFKTIKVIIAARKKNMVK